MKKIRSMKITIDLPTESSQVWTQVILQKVIKTEQGVVIQTIDDVERITKPLPAFAMQMINITDPVTQQNITISGAGVAQAITQAILEWMHEKFEGAIINGEFIEEET